MSLLIRMFGLLGLFDVFYMACAHPSDECQPDLAQADTNNAFLKKAGDEKLLHCEPEYLGSFNVDLVPQPPEVSGRQFLGVQGGEWKPRDCVPQQSIAVIVPYRDREEHLQILLPNIHRFLQAQKAHYIIILAQQTDDAKHFNRGAMKNIGYLEARKLRHFDCVIFQDVDKYPEDTSNLYSCSDKPKLLVGQSRYTSSRAYSSLPYDTFFGGVIALSPNQFEAINGYSNEYWGWGSEDDDLYNRVIDNGLDVERVPQETGKFVEMWHPYDDVNSDRHELLQMEKARYKSNGLNSIRNMYKTVARNYHHLYVNITAKLLIEDTFPDDVCTL